MARGWLGAGILLLFLVLGLVVTGAMDKSHLSTGQMLAQAAEQSLEGDLDGATALAMAAKARWERQHQGTATVADHNPMDDVDRLFAQMEVYAKAQEAPHFAACCAELAHLLQATADAHRFSWWNVL